MAGLRERQKEDRRTRIIAAAQTLFERSGLDNITLEAIADIAGVSSVTIHNYYGSKSGVLLALVAESDRQLIETFDRILVGRSKDIVDLSLRFARIICDHTLTHLDKAIWRQVIAASVSDSDPRFGKVYRDLDLRLVAVLVREIERLQAAGMVAATVSPQHLGRALFNLQNMRFIQFISSNDVSKSEIVGLLRSDLGALLAVSR